VLLLCDISLHSAVKEQLKCNTGKLFNFLNQFLLTAVLSIEERVFLVEYVFREGNRYTHLVQEQFAGPLAHRILLHHTFICGGQQNLQCIVIAHTCLIN